MNTPRRVCERCKHIFDDDGTGEVQYMDIHESDDCIRSLAERLSELSDRFDSLLSITSSMQREINEGKERT